MPTVSIRLLRDPSNFLQCEQIQKEVWGTVSLSAEALRVVGDFGGMVLGCFEGGRLLGFISALLARRHGELVHWSFQMAVRKRHRDRGLGFRMKLAHRRLALKNGIRSICWSYDPLQSRNAALNIRRLRALPEEYAEDYYGHFPSLIERGVPSDRFLVRWKIASPVVERHLRKGTSGGSETLFASSQVANVTERLTNGFLTNRKVRLGLEARRLLVEIPCDTDRMRQKDLPLALDWRMATRKLFPYYLRRGYRVTDFLQQGPPSHARYFYLLEKRRPRR